MNDEESPTVVHGVLPAPEVGRDAGDKPPCLDAALGDDASLTQVSSGHAGPPVALQSGMPAGRLRDEGEIARGGMGSIHRVYDATLRRRVALKIIEPGLAGDPRCARRFVNEARITGALAHPNIVPVHDLMTDGGDQASYTMKLVDGRKLTALIDAQTCRRDLELILQSLASVCDALAYAHSRGIIHCDVKPDNIMVGEFGEVYLMDWGCALVIGDRTLIDGAIDSEGSVAGTPRYMAPEQARGEISRIDARTDVFAVGAILYKAITGQAPYAGPPAEALAAARRADFRPLDDAAGKAVKPPPMLTAIVKKAMAADPAGRHQSAAELAEDLRDFLRGGNWYAMQDFPAGSVIVREGDWADAAYIIAAGRCEVRRADPGAPGRSLVLRVLERGDVFGEAAIFADAPRSASVVAVDDVSVVVVDRATLELSNGTVLGQFVKALARRFMETGGKA